MSGAFDDEELHIFLVLVASYKTDMLDINFHGRLVSVRLETHSFQIFLGVDERNHIIPVSREKVNFDLVYAD